VDVEYLDSATSGASFTAKSNGIYEISYSDNASVVSATFGISKNASSLTTNITLLPANESLAMQQVDGTVDVRANASWTGYLVAGDIIRPHTSGAAASTNANTAFTMSKVGKPNVTGVNVTPFVNVPQPVKESVRLSGHTGYGSTSTGILRFTSVGSNTNNGVLSYVSDSVNGDYFIANKSCTFSGEVEVNVPTASPYIYVGVYSSLTTQLTGQGVASAGIYTVSSQQLTTASGTQAYVTSFTGRLEAGQYIRVGSSTSGITAQRLNILAEALSDQILTVPETFSTDTASLQYASSAAYTLSTLSNAPVGTFITFTYAASTNTRTQTTTAPTQTTASMNANGILVYSRTTYAAGTTAALPAAVAIQIGKGLKGNSLGFYKSAGKSIGGSLDYFLNGTTVQKGMQTKNYNESTGVLLLDAGFAESASLTQGTFYFEDISNQDFGYLVINASKNPALTGFRLNRVAARGVSTSGQIIPNAVSTTLTWDAAKVYDTNGALNAATGIFTAPETGYYSITAGILYSSNTWAAGDPMDLNVVKNGVIVKSHRQNTTASTTNFGVDVSDIVFLAVNDTLSVSAFHSRGAGTSLLPSAPWCTISIAKVSL
jgi:hypothetical protein